MHLRKLWPIASASFLTVFPATYQPATAQPKQARVDLKGNWQESSPIFTWSNPGIGCEVNPRVVFRKLTITQKGSSLIIPPFRYWGSPKGQRGSYSSTTPQVSGQIVSFTIKGGGFTAKYKGTISSDGNKITGLVHCTHTSGSVDADVPFLLTRLSSQPSLPSLPVAPTPGLD